MSRLLPLVGCCALLPLWTLKSAQSKTCRRTFHTPAQRPQTTRQKASANRRLQATATAQVAPPCCPAPSCHSAPCPWTGALSECAPPAQVQHSSEYHCTDSLQTGMYQLLLRPSATFHDLQVVTHARLRRPHVQSARVGGVHVPMGMACQWCARVPIEQDHAHTHHRHMVCMGFATRQLTIRDTILARYADVVSGRCPTAAKPNMST